MQKQTSLPQTTTTPLQTVQQLDHIQYVRARDGLLCVHPFSGMQVHAVAELTVKLLSLIRNCRAGVLGLQIFCCNVLYV